jgi:hypothetical protein
MLTFESVARATRANISRGLEQIRRIQQPSSRALRVLCALDCWESEACNMNRSGVIVAAFRRDILRILAPRELAENRRALAIITTFGRGYATEFEEAMPDFFQSWGQLLESQLPGTPTLEATSALVAQLAPRLSEWISRTAKQYELAEWRRIQRNLRRDGVPDDLLQT